MKSIEQVKVVLIANRDDRMEFDLVFADNCVKRYQLDSYQIKQFRGAGLRDLIEACADEFLWSIGKTNYEIRLIFT